MNHIILKALVFLVVAIVQKEVCGDGYQVDECGCGIETVLS